ncbi:MULTISPECIES: glucose-1-phosphate adenylyltransferase [Marisediminitalea]|jgi:glucose-1-phosphate adenylyltransferase|uniref:glucose-1-phosphate adenylyltransferase n=1 Tax=Marisediminitalea TaxID=2662254 RepID=UPI0020CC1E57|nr:glucose-1-phosphate adenylyltransferase [Marisediminitalea aggregata]MCP3862539.1 glucose-1-phosphate adenylyltransferase [Aestuariibacter sp.]MCP4232505.1 glucose-1-phosphate adenylyltransferase [Aestuariibacter sp.]MCP4528815.1 glucose-1-phosphate adenylyltransferase [Aestuariibacter sp.]MCP4946684.1 glucose-1-phosphate adenylyltransferase [Aestuariibacter sp.]MCP5011347.1 glucose-1-phosphate adenylyltransferase [Aestuariibacter sp.]|tara:strand:- start:3552 stop:4832 length:1281 start_codon:yes stop_codon:yes gene_type:complete
MADNSSRYISNLTRDTYALILAGGRGSRLHELTTWRAKPALYFGGKFRIIDFPLSNCINSGIRRIGVITQYKSHSLIRHLVRGWGHFKKELGESVEILPASQRFSENWYEGTADAVFQNIDIIREELPKYVMILSGDHIYRMDYGDLLARHVETGAKMTVCCMKVPLQEAAGAFGVMSVDEDLRIKGFTEKPESPDPVPGEPDMCLASMGNYVFETEFLFEQLRRDAETSGSERDFGKDIIPSIIQDHDVYAYPFQSNDNEHVYWRDVGTLDSFWEANMEMVTPVPALNLYDRKWPIWTYQEQLPPAKFVWEDQDRRGEAINSVVSGGCIISGSTLRRSLCFSNVRVHSYGLIEEAVLLPDVEIKRHCRLRKVIIDRGCVIPEGMVIGYDHDEDRRRGFRVSPKGVVLVTREMLGQPVGGAMIPQD